MLKDYDVKSEIWSVTSFNMLRKDGMEIENQNIKNPTAKQKKSFVEEAFSKNDIPTIASTDYMSCLLYTSPSPRDPT